MERHFPRNLEALTEVFEFLDACLLVLAVNRSDAFAVRLAVEEFFTNMVKYNTTSVKEIGLRLRSEDSVLVVDVIDEDADPFDVTAVPEANTSLPLEDRNVGGLGIHLARTLVDSIRYRYDKRCSTITFTKRLG
jgi:serine/threonine-protein kinase RsbW